MQQLLVIFDQFFTLIPVVFLLFTVNFHNFGRNFKHNAASFQGKSHTIRWMCKWFHHHKVAHLKSFQCINGLLEKGFSYSQSSLTILLDVLGNFLFLHSRFSFNIDNLCNLLDFFRLTIYLFHSSIDLLGLLLQNWSQIVQLNLHLFDHYFGFVQFVHTLLIFAPLLLNLFVLSCQDFFEELKHTGKHDWSHVDIFLLFTFVLLSEPHDRLMNLCENVTDPLPKTHCLNSALLFVLLEIVWRYGCVLLFIFIEIHARF